MSDNTIMYKVSKDVRDFNVLHKLESLFNYWEYFSSLGFGKYLDMENQLERLLKNERPKNDF